jgi:hypothetical protein
MFYFRRQQRGLLTWIPCREAGWSKKIDLVGQSDNVTVRVFGTSIPTQSLQHLPQNLMSVANTDPAHCPRPGIAGLAVRVVRGAERFVRGNSERAVIAPALAGFFVLWLLHHIVTRASVDPDADISGISLLVEQFGFGNRHPPLTVWLFGSWFAVFPRANWALYMLVVAMATVTLAITWRLLRDHLDANRALFGVAALALLPFYTFRASFLDENSVMMPFWAAALLFYLRARRGLGTFDALLAGAFAGFGFLGKYWTIYLFAGMAAASLIGARTKRFWRSPAPYLMATAAAVVVAPYFYSLLTDSAATSYTFLQNGVMTADSFGEALANSGAYLLGCAAYAAIPLVFLATLRPSRATLLDIAWPGDQDRRQVLLLFLVPLVAPAIMNLMLPHRLTPVWTFPNWALLPAILYASPRITVTDRDVARAGIFVLAVSVAAALVSPLLAYLQLQTYDPARAHARQVVDAAERFAGQRMHMFWGSEAAVSTLAFYVPKARRLVGNPLSAESRAAIAANGIIIICLDDDAPCRATGSALASAEDRRTDLTLTRTFFGFAGPSARYHIIVVPAERATEVPRSRQTIGSLSPEILPLAFLMP